MNKRNFGIDRFVVSGFSAIEINKDQFNLLRNDMKYSKEGHLYFKSRYIKSDIDFSYLLIDKNDFFNRLNIGVKKIDCKFLHYVKLEICNNGEHRNLHPQSLKKCADKIDRALEYIKKYYGIVIKKDKVKFDEIEITMDIETDYPFEDYSSILNTFSALSSKNYNKCINKDKKYDLNSIELKNKRCSLIIYDKKKQLASKKVYIEQHRMRFEYTLTQNKDCGKIKSTFGTAYFQDFDDKMLASFFEKQISKDIFNRFALNTKQVKKMVQQNLINSFQEQYWLKSLLKYLNQELDSFVLMDKITLFDIEELKELIKKKDPKNFTRNYKKIMDSCPKSFINVNKKIKEIQDKIKKNLSSILEEL